MTKYLFIIILFLSLTATGQKIYKTPSGKKYHLGSCRMVENVSEEIPFEQAAELGLEPCKICKPQDYTTLGLKSSKNTAQGQSGLSSAEARPKKGHGANTGQALPMAIVFSTTRINKPMN